VISPLSGPWNKSDSSILFIMLMSVSCMTLRIDTSASILTLHRNHGPYHIS